MTHPTCKVWECSEPRYNNLSGYCKRHKEAVHHNGHPTFKLPVLNRRKERYDQELSVAYRGSKRWYKEAELTHYHKAFSQLLDQAQDLKPLSHYRRLGDLSIDKQLLYLLKLSIESRGREETQRQWLCVYRAAHYRRALFPNRKTFAAFVCRKSLLGRVSMPKHKTRKGKLGGYRLNANRALAKLDILEPIFELSFISANDMALWYRFYFRHLNYSNIGKQTMKRKQAQDPDFPSSLTRKRIIKSIEKKYTGGLNL